LTEMKKLVDGWPIILLENIALNKKITKFSSKLG
jgi:hypothetical protein